jgi:chromate reductase
MAQPEAYISHVVSLFDEQGRLTNDSTREFLAKFVSAFERFVGEHIGAMAFS